MTTPQSDTAKTEAFVGRLFKAAVDAIDLFSVYLGDRLGLYRALADSKPVTYAELARLAGIHPRYAREWLEQQAVTAFLEVDNTDAPAEKRRYTLPAAHVPVFTDPESPFSMAPLARAVASFGPVLPQLLEAYKTGGGVPWSAYGRDGIEAQGDFNRPWLLASFGNDYLPSIPDVHSRLQANPPAKVLDVACGVGWSSIAIAKAYPKAKVLALDLDELSIKIGLENAVTAGVDRRITFETRDIVSNPPRDRYDLAVVIEAIHDMSKPVELLRAIRNVLKPTGVLIVADERVADKFTLGDDLERLFYRASIMLCLPTGMAEQPSAATGTVIRTDTMRKYAAEAGFHDMQVLSIEHPALRFYRLTR